MIPTYKITVTKTSPDQAWTDLFTLAAPSPDFEWVQQVPLDANTIVLFVTSRLPEGEVLLRGFVQA